MESSEQSSSQTAQKKPYISASAINAYFKCGEIYRRRYIEKQIVPPSSFLIKGSAVHLGAEENFKQKIKSFVDLPASKIKDATASAFDTRVNKEGILLTQEEEKVGLSLIMARAKDNAVKLADIYAHEVAPVHQPVTVEQFQRIALNDKTDLLVKMDMVNTRNEIVDLKTSRRSMNEKQLSEDIQFDLYGMAYRAINGKDAEKIVIENLVEAPKNPKRTLIELKKDMRHYKRAADKLNLFLFGTESGVFMPAAKGSWFCNENYCGYARECKFYQYYQKGGGNIQRPFGMNFKKKKKEGAK